MDLEVELKVQKDIRIEWNCQKIGPYLYDGWTDTIFYTLPYPFPCKFAVRSLSEIRATKAMMRLPGFLKFHNIDFLMQQLFQIKCIQNNCLLLHGAAWQIDRKGYLAVGFPDSGKTTRVLREMQRGANFCADENVMVRIDKGKKPLLMSVKRKTSLNPWISKEINFPLTARQKVQFFLSRLRSKIIPILEPNIWVDLPYLRKSFELDKLIFLNEGRGQSLLTLTNNEFPFITNPLIQAYSFSTRFDLEGIYNKYKKLIKEVECYRS